jgi:hypothetical protein
MRQIKIVTLISLISCGLTAQNLIEIQKLEPTDPTPNFSYGSNVSVDVDYAIVGSPLDDDNGSESGSATIYLRGSDPNEPWQFVKELTSSDAAIEDRFGYCAIVNDIAVVGSPWDDDNGDRSGSAYIFQKDHGGQNNWGELKKIIASDGNAIAYFGANVAISGDIIAVGGRAQTQRGAVYIFSKNQGGLNNWGEVIKIISPSASDRTFGSGISIDGDLLIVGDQYEDTDGSAYIFGRNIGGSNNWGLIKKLVAFDAAHEDRFGEDVVINGDIAVVGAYGDDDKGRQSGSAYIYGKDVGGVNNWGLIKKIVADDGIPGQWYGYGVEMHDDRIAITAYHDNEQGQSSGSVYLYEEDEGVYVFKGLGIIAKRRFF